MKAPSQVSDRVTVDCVAHYTDDLDGEVAGVQDYGDRSVLLASRAAVVHAHHGVPYLESYHQYLQDLGLGAEEIVPVNGAMSLFTSIQKDPNTRDKIKRMVNEEGCRIDAFCSYDPFARFVEEMQLDREQVRSTLDLELVTHLDNKRRLRELDDRLNGGGSFPDNTVICDRADVHTAVQTMLNKHGQIILKADDLESGVGTNLFTKMDAAALDAHLTAFDNDARFWIVEQAIRNPFEGSVQWYITPADNGLQKRFLSRQYMEGAAHQGNGIPYRNHDAFPSDWDRSDRRRLTRDVWNLTRPFAQWAKEQGYVGYLGFDFLVDRNTREVYILEANARKTGATYPESVRWQIEVTGRLKTPCVTMRNCHPNAHLNDYRKVVDRLAYHGLAMDADTGTGVVIANPRCLLGDHPKCILICVEDDLLKAENTLEVALGCVQ